MSFTQRALTCFLFLLLHSSFCLGRHVAETLSCMAFGSCNKQHKPQPAWEQIAELNPQAWLWMGDAVYTEAPYGPQQQREALEHQMRVPEYVEFLKHVPVVEGVWDDHDLGPNDCGRTVGDISERRDNYLDFLGVEPSDPRKSQSSLHFPLTFGSPPSRVKFIVLDIRSHRDRVPFANFDSRWWRWRYFRFVDGLQALARGIRALFCLYSDYDGDVLGEEQWLWLEQELSNSSAAAHIIVSSMQVFSGCAFCEGWGFFPRALNRLASLLLKINPNGLMFLSGDVHLAEVIKSRCIGQGGTNPGAVEVTSSGLTHCISKRLARYLEKLTKKYDDRDIHIVRNWGSVQMNWATDRGETSCERCANNERICKGNMTFSIHNVDKGGETIPDQTTWISTCDRWKERNMSSGCFKMPLEGKRCQRNRSFLRGLTFILPILILSYFTVVRKPKRNAGYRQNKGHFD